MMMVLCVDVILILSWIWCYGMGLGELYNGWFGLIVIIGVRFIEFV